MLTWNKDLEVHIGSIDMQHRTLIALINELQQVIDQRKPEVMVGSILSKVIEYARFHFEHEENCLIVACYAKLSEHRCRHNELSVTLKQLERDYRNGVPGVAVVALETLQRWVVDHIMRTDRLYADDLVKAGLQ